MVMIGTSGYSILIVHFGELEVIPPALFLFNVPDLINQAYQSDAWANVIGKESPNNIPSTTSISHSFNNSIVTREERTNSQILGLALFAVFWVFFHNVLLLIAFFVPTNLLSVKNRRRMLDFCQVFGKFIAFFQVQGMILPVCLFFTLFFFLFLLVLFFF